MVHGDEILLLQEQNGDNGMDQGQTCELNTSIISLSSAKGSSCFMSHVMVVMVGRGGGGGDGSGSGHK